jgi:hypothetical protein
MKRLNIVYAVETARGIYRRYQTAFGAATVLFWGAALINWRLWLVGEGSFWTAALLTVPAIALFIVCPERPIILACTVAFCAFAGGVNWYEWFNHQVGLREPLFWTAPVTAIFVFSRQRRMLVFAAAAVVTMLGLKGALIGHEPRAWFIALGAAVVAGLVLLTFIRQDKSSSG